MCLGRWRVMLRGEGTVRMGGREEGFEDGDGFVGRRRKGFDSIGARGVGGEDSSVLNFERR